MAQLSQPTVARGLHFQQRISAKLVAQASWTDPASGNAVFVKGFTENLGETNALVNLDVLPPVGSEVTLRLYNEENFILETQTRVIRVERDPGKPLAALSILKDQKRWREKALPAAQDWLTEHWRLNYEEDWVN